MSLSKMQSFYVDNVHNGFVTYVSLVLLCALHVGLTCRHSKLTPKQHAALQDDFLEVTKDYPEAWHSMNLVAEHRIRMLHSSPAFTQWQDNQKKQPSPSSKLSIKIEQVLEVPTCTTDPAYTNPVLQYVLAPYSNTLVDKVPRSNAACCICLDVRHNLSWPNQSGTTYPATE